MAQTSKYQDPGIGGRLRAARQRLGWSREALAFCSGMSWSAIAQIESGRRKNIRPDTLSALSGALGVTTDYLIHGGSPPATMLRHQVLLYRTDEQFLEAAGPFLVGGMERSEALLAVTTKRNIELLQQRLTPSAGQIEFVEASTFYRSPVAALTTYREFIEDKVTARAAWVRIIGEPVWVGRSDSEIRRWEQYESLINLAFAPLPVTLLCPYDEMTVEAAIASTARQTHSQILSGPDVTPNPLYRDPGEFVLGHEKAPG